MSSSSPVMARVRPAAGPSDHDVEVSLVTETYNLGEGSALERLRESLRAGARLEAGARGERLLVQVADDGLGERLEREFPGLRVVDAVGCGYDEAKTRAALAARGRYVVFLDGDCVPEAGWLDALLAPLRAGEARACAGFTRYEGGFWAALLTVMDFGFLLPPVARALGCYSSNNVAFEAELLRECGIPDGPMRCRCYAHAQALARRGTPVWMAPGARVRHALPPFWQERTRQGYDRVAACWVDPSLPEASELRRGLRALPGFYATELRLDRGRLRRGASALGLSAWQVRVARLLLPVLRLVDALGMARALVQGPPRVL